MLHLFGSDYMASMMIKNKTLPIIGRRRGGEGKERRKRVNKNMNSTGSWGREE